jgi:hypothetical protein
MSKQSRRSTLEERPKDSVNSPETLRDCVLKVEGFSGRWVSQDYNGSVHVYKDKPDIGESAWIGTPSYLLSNSFGYCPDNWRDTLVEVPDNFFKNLPIDPPPQVVDVKPDSYKGLKSDSNKRQWGLLPWNALKIVVDVLMFGAKKYAPENWKLVDNAEERYKDAAMRHLAAVFEGEWLDSESGLPHLAHLVCCALFMLSLHKEGTGLDVENYVLTTKEFEENKLC